MQLPHHERRRGQFDAIFELPATEAIAAMNASGRDVANQQPLHKLGLKRMGVTRTAIPVRIHDPLGGKELVHLSCNVAVHVSLAEDRRGIHVSRLCDALARLTTESYATLSEYAERLAESIRKGQQAASARVEVEGLFSYLEPLRGVKTKLSLETLALLAGATADDSAPDTTLGLAFNHITACPCVQETYRHSYGEPSAAFIAEIERKAMPLLTHSQRCRTSVEIRGATRSPNLTTLLNAVDGVVVRCQNTMPRELELQTVHAAHLKAQFLEDVLRDLASSIGEVLKGNPPSTQIRVRSVSMESIHDFDLDGELDTTLGELVQLADAA